MKARGKYSIEISPDHVTVIGGEKEEIRCAPAEAAILRKLIGFSIDVSQFKAVPEKITMSPFVVFFRDDGMCRVRRVVDLSGGLVYEPEKAGDLVDSIDIAVDCLVDSVRIAGPRPTVSPHEGPSPVIEGR
jgi:hypothetical protein